MRIVFMGTSEFGLPSLERLVLTEHEMVAVYTQPDRPAGRGRKPRAPAIKSMALEKGLPVFQPESLKESFEIDRLTALNPDCIIVIAYGQLLPRKVLDIPPFGCLNVHPSLLPKYRGPSPVASAILNGEQETGVSIMLMDEGMDTGPVLVQKRVRIEPLDTTMTLEARLAIIGAETLLEVLPKWFEQKLEPKRQDDREATYSVRISKKDGMIDWRLSAEELARRVRAFYPWPGSYARWKGKMLKIIEAEAVPSEVKVDPGVVLTLPNNPRATVAVGTGDGLLGLQRVQMEGRKVVTADEFVRGQKDFLGARLL